MSIPIATSPGRGGFGRNSGCRQMIERLILSRAKYLVPILRLGMTANCARHLWYIRNGYPNQLLKRIIGPTPNLCSPIRPSEWLQSYFPTRDGEKVISEFWDLYPKPNSSTYLFICEE